MLFLMFRIGRDRYVLDAAQIEQVLPLMQAKAVPGAPRGVVGLLNYHGTPVPLIDLCELATGQPAALVMSTRIILVRAGGDAAAIDEPAGGQPAGAGMQLALCAEQVVETVDLPPEAFVATGVEAGMAGYLGPVCPHGDGFLQWVRAETLLTDEIRAALGAPMADMRASLSATGLAAEARA